MQQYDVSSSQHNTASLNTKHVSNMDNIMINSAQQQTYHTSPLDSLEEEEDVAQRNIQMMFEKKKYRRESHNAIERRRRDDINERINDLLFLLPNNNQDLKLSKGTILKKSVDHIHSLHDNLRLQQQRIKELEALIEMHQQQSIMSNVINLTSIADSSLLNKRLNYK
ncbi:Myc-type, basic helix-loop-helix domain-containing protein [Cokeromyces recurvatus]|uniref:Myc-type, basic helix-loop-helix domain-containing protein n=1 Tax=Cokeromyces recurvatus TaxID=90255 RepID=UPI0022204FD1|nr:Myc-type, basic helix-loop-helix domain-containing protein [Cokeromyces recurvatus]KAI7905801.1 Myc-type, basic helix-loop-helix domain-containing protein [Cokeromyces recurvatus]